MRSRRDYIVTKDEVYSYANNWLSAALRLEHQGTKCTASTVLQVLLIAAARAVSIFAACRDLADAPSDQTIRNALAASLPAPPELERRLNRALATDLPKALRRKARMIRSSDVSSAIVWALLPVFSLLPARQPAVQRYSQKETRDQMPPFRPGWKSRTGPRSSCSRHVGRPQGQCPHDRRA